MTDVGLEPTHPKIVELESTPLDHSGNLSIPINIGKCSLPGSNR